MPFYQIKKFLPQKKKKHPILNCSIKQVEIAIKNTLTKAYTLSHFDSVPSNLKHISIAMYKQMALAELSIYRQRSMGQNQSGRVYCMKISSN